jgi:hypothetical protein
MTQFVSLSLFRSVPGRYPVSLASPIAEDGNQASTKEARISYNRSVKSFFHTCA